VGSPVSPGFRRRSSRIDWLKSSDLRSSVLPGERVVHMHGSGGSMFTRLLGLVGLLFLTQASLAQSSQTTTGDVPGTCPVTKASDHSFIPSWPYPTAPYLGGSWFGTDKLWTILPEAGTWRAPSLQYTPSGLPLREKSVWFSHSDGRRTDQESYLSVTGTRLDSPGPPLMADQSKPACCWAGRDQAYMMTVLTIPTLGCWEVTGRLADDKLTFVVWVAK
jgi:hypothetical protein